MRVLESLIDNDSDVISLVNRAGRVLYASAPGTTIFGYLPEEIVGRDSFDLIHPEDQDQSRRALDAVLDTPSRPNSISVKVRLLRKDGAWCWVENTMFNCLDEPGIEAIVVNCRAIHEKAGVEERKRDRSQAGELIRANARLEDFAYAVAHDLREPLRTISMFTELLVEDGELSESGKIHAKFVMDGVARMSALFEGLHAFATSGFDDPDRPIDLGHTVANVLRDLGHAIKTADATITVAPLPIVLGNEKHVARVFQNLIANAIKYRSESPVEIHVTAERLGAEWIIKVMDNGVGIPPEHHDSVFSLFTRLHGPETAGAGIGLAICRKVVEATGGAIWVESAPREGSNFCFTIAAVQDAVQAAVQEGASLSQLPSRRNGTRRSARRV